MLQVIREKTQGFLAWGIVVLIIVVFSLVGINNYTSKGSNSVVAAKVDGKKILWREIEILAERQRQYLAETNPQLLNELDPSTIKMELRHYLIQQTALDLQTRRLGLVITEQQLAQRIANDPIFQENGKFSVEKYQQVLKKMAIPEASYTENVTASMLQEQVRDGLTVTSFVQPNEIKNIMALFLQQRDFGYLVVPANKFKQDMTIDDVAIKKYYEENKHNYVAPEQVKLAYVELTLEQLVNSITVSDEQLKAYYKQHLAMYTVPEMVEVSHILISAAKDSDAAKSGEAKAKIDDILAKVKLGANFSALAKQYSEDPISGADGGKLGKIGRGQTVTEFETAAFALAKPNAVSEVIQTEFGYHIIKLLKKHAAHVQKYADVKKQLAENYRRELAETQFADKAEELANLAFEYPESLQYAADKMHLSVQETKLFTKGNRPTVGIASIPKVVTAAFDEELIKQTRNSDLIKVDDERYVVIRVIQHLPTKVLKLAEVRQQIILQLQTAAASKQAAAFGQKLLAQINQGNTPHAIAKTAGLSWNFASDIERNNTKINPLILAKAFALPKPDQQKLVNFGFQLPDGDYAVLSLKSVKVSDKAAEPAIQQQFKQELASVFAQIELQLYQMVLINNAKIIIER